MEELMAQMGEDNISSVQKGDFVEGEIVEITPSRMVVDLGWKAEGLVAESAFEESKDFIRTLNEGDKIRARVIVPETPDGYVILTLRETASNVLWEKLEKLEKEDKPIEVTVKNMGDSGATVDVMGSTGFIPASHMSRLMAQKGAKNEGQKVETLVLELDREGNRIVLSEKYVTEKDLVEKERQAIENITEGEVYKGKVSTVADFGAFVTIPVEVKKETIEVDGLVHISELSWQKVAEASSEVKVGDKVDVKVIGKSNGKLSLSMKQAQKDPWDEAIEKYSPDTRVEGKVVKTSDFGYFVQLEPGIEGLLHLTKIPPGKKISVGDSVNVYVEEIDEKNRKISLGLVQTTKTTVYK